MRLFFRLSFLLGAIFAVGCGLGSLRDLREMGVPPSSYGMVPGRLLTVERRLDNLSETKPLVHRVSFEYQFAGQVYRGHAWSTVCEECDAQDVKRITGRRPEQLVTGEALTVYVRQGEPGT